MIKIFNSVSIIDEKRLGISVFLSQHTHMLEPVDAGNSDQQTHYADRAGECRKQFEGFCIGFFFIQKTVGSRLCDLKLPETLGLTALIYSHTKVIN